MPGRGTQAWQSSGVSVGGAEGRGRGGRRRKVLRRGRRGEVLLSRCFTRGLTSQEEGRYGGEGIGGRRRGKGVTKRGEKRWERQGAQSTPPLLKSPSHASSPATPLFLHLSVDAQQQQRLLIFSTSTKLTSPRDFIMADLLTFPLPKSLSKAMQINYLKHKVEGEDETNFLIARSLNFFKKH